MIPTRAKKKWLRKRVILLETYYPLDAAEVREKHRRVRILAEHPSRSEVRP